MNSLMKMVNPLPMMCRLEGARAARPSVDRLPQHRPEAGLNLDFRKAPLENVVSYMSEAAGLIIHVPSNVPPQPTVDLCREQPVSPADAVSLFKEVLTEKGWIPIQKGRFLRIIRNQDAKKYCIPLPAV